MISLYGLAIMAISTSGTMSAEAIAPDGRRVASTTMAFNIKPVGDEVLQSFVGARAEPFGRNVRQMSDVESAGALQQFGQTSRIAMDNWWSQTGAALIVNNLLAGRP